jgi:DNA-binding NarL/FixJ family response regulator
VEVGRTEPQCLGEVPRRGEGELTARETQVLELIAGGMPNRAIAQKLFVSVRTVEKHVERLLAKTGSINRSQLATYAVRLADLLVAAEAVPMTMP